MAVGGTAPAGAQDGLAGGSAYVRPYGPNAPWNLPVTGLPRHPDSEVYARRLWRHAPADQPGNFNLRTDGYTYPVYDARDANRRWIITTERESELHGKGVPWNPDWRPAAGSDAQAIVINPNNGREWNLWQVEVNEGSLFATDAHLVPGDYRTREKGYRPTRGSGIPYLAMLVRPEEIEAGVIEHALSLPIRNTDGAVFLPPATKLEHAHHPDNGVPEGMRFALQFTDAGIERWLDSLPRDLPSATRRSAQIIATALRDYGWFITDTAGGASFQFEDRASAGDDWDRLGLGGAGIDGRSYPRDLLDGLLRRDRIYALAPPTVPVARRPTSISPN